MDIYAAVLALLLVYNNSIVLLGPSAWGAGLGFRKAYFITLAGITLGAATSPLRPIQVGPAEFLYLTALYLLLTLVKISIPLAVAAYSITGLSTPSALLWLTSPMFAVLTYPLCRLLKGGGGLTAPSLFLIAYLFGLNNVALFTTDLSTTFIATAIGVYLGISLSKWVLDLVAIRPRTALVTNITVAIAALAGASIHVPISFTLVAYSSLLAAASAYKIRIIKIEKFVKAYLGIVAALVSALIFPFLKSQLLHLASPAG
ncbi:MAG: hypothetical protein ABWK05_05670 [Pyrobaculum sp.]